jgi:hypothetical protein
VPFDSINYVAHDTARVQAGGGSHSGRSMKLAATIIDQATDDIIAKGRKIAMPLNLLSGHSVSFSPVGFALKLGELVSRIAHEIFFPLHPLPSSSR